MTQQVNPFNAAMQRLANLQQMMKNGVLIADEDFGNIPPSKKPTLLKPGAQKLMLAFDLASTIKDVQRIADENSVHYTVTVTLTNKQTGHLEGEGVGSCNSKERNYAKQSVADIDNTVLKMAKKRALVDSVLDATGSASMFTQDLEDMRGMNLESFNPQPVEPTDGLWALVRELNSKAMRIIGKEPKQPKKTYTAAQLRDWLGRVDAIISEKEAQLMQEDHEQECNDSIIADEKAMEDAPIER